MSFEMSAIGEAAEITQERICFDELITIKKLEKFVLLNCRKMVLSNSSMDIR